MAWKHLARGLLLKGGGGACAYSHRHLWCNCKIKQPPTQSLRTVTDLQSGQHDLHRLSFLHSGDRQTIKVTLLPTCSHQPSIDRKNSSAPRTLCPWRPRFPDYKPLWATRLIRQWISSGRFHRKCMKRDSWVGVGWGTMSDSLSSFTRLDCFFIYCTFYWLLISSIACWRSDS